MQYCTHSTIQAVCSGGGRLGLKIAKWKDRSVYNVYIMFICVPTYYIIPSYTPIWRIMNTIHVIIYASWYNNIDPRLRVVWPKFSLVVFTFSFNFIRTKIGNTVLYVCACVYRGFPRCCLYNIIYKHRFYNIIVFYARDNNDNNNMIITVHGVGGLKRLFLLSPPPLHLLLKAGARAKDIIHNKTITKS